MLYSHKETPGCPTTIFRGILIGLGIEVITAAIVLAIWHFLYSLKILGDISCTMQALTLMTSRIHLR